MIKYLNLYVKNYSFCPKMIQNTQNELYVGSQNVRTNGRHPNGTTLFIIITVTT